MSSIICFSGWGQKYNSLEFIFSDPFFIGNKVTSLDYLSSPSSDEFFSNFRCDDHTPKIAVGWSLGALISLQLIAKDKIRPEMLVLFAPPFQFIADDNFVGAMSKKSYNSFAKRLDLAPDYAISKFSKMIAYNDNLQDKILSSLTPQKSSSLKYWLEYLANSSCHDLDFSKIPKTLIISGKEDIVVDCQQSRFFEEKIANCNSLYLQKSSHAPHLHDVDLVRKAIINFCNEN